MRTAPRHLRASIFLRTMHVSTRTKSIVAALLLGGVMVAGAFWLSSPSVRTAQALSTEDILRAYAMKDTDADGLPDWQEALYGTDPRNPRSVDPNMTDAEAVASGKVTPTFTSEETPERSIEVPGIDAGPETLTDRFGKKFLENYLRLNEGMPLSPEDMTAFIASASKELAEERGARFTLSDLTVVGGGEDALFTYVTTMDRVLTEHSASHDEKNVYDYFGEYVMGIETEHSMARIRELAQAYAESAEAIMQISVPSTVSGPHLDFANAYAGVGAVVEDMASMPEDPLRGLLGLLSYLDAWSAYSDALSKLGQTLDTHIN